MKWIILVLMLIPLFTGCYGPDLTYASVEGKTTTNPTTLPQAFYKEGGIILIDDSTSFEDEGYAVTKIGGGIHLRDLNQSQLGCLIGFRRSLGIPRWHEYIVGYHDGKFYDEDSYEIECDKKCRNEILEEGWTDGLHNISDPKAIQKTKVVCWE